MQSLLCTNALIVTLLLSSVASASNEDDGLGAAQKPLVFLTGPVSQVNQTAYHRITSAGQWKEVWLAHNGKTPEEAFHERLPALEVDFDRCMVVAIFQGAGTNSRGLNIESITVTDADILVRFNEWRYQTQGGSHRSSAYGFVVMQRSDKTVVLEEGVQRLKDQAPKWKERARLTQSPSPQQQ